MKNENIRLFCVAVIMSAVLAVCVGACAAAILSFDAASAAGILG